MSEFSTGYELARRDAVCTVAAQQLIQYLPMDFASIELISEGLGRDGRSGTFNGRILLNRRP